ncbi:helicase-associated domain-containing protein [Fodinisporobacter ferrooxydans]|uniref:Helicase-associated domain-containing protein n=1 Tax=Fodinisporobacter ferrooxydans TaxID=2901836 RepID=A0ABY4CH16_9BACL|nr:helicase-associated domain-containing protein [Alicyclobacillaceae bacterium MYW30-H2]
MNLITCLNDADIHVLRTIAKRQNLSCRYHSKNDLLQTLMEHFQNVSFVQERLAKLAQAQKRLLIRLALDKRSQFTREDLLVAAEKTLGDRIGKVGPEGLWTELVDLGWIFRSGTSIYSHVFRIPDDLRGMIKQWIAIDLTQNVDYLEREPSYYREDGLAMLRDLQKFLQFVAQNEIRLTQDGAIFKRFQQQLQQLFEIQEPPISGQQWRFGYGRRFRDYPDRFALLYDFCFGKGWIVEGRDGILQSCPPEEDWFAKPDLERISELHGYWEKIYGRCIPQLHLAVAFLAYACKEKWAVAESLEKVLQHYIEPYYYDTVSTIIHERIVQMLRYLGILKTGKREDGGVAVTLTQIGRQLFFPDEYAPLSQIQPPNVQPSIVVQPNFEILVLAEGHSPMDQELYAFADYLQGGHVRSYRITETSVKRFVKNGHSPEQIRSVLDRYSIEPVPEMVLQRIGQWTEGYGKIRAFQGTLLECADECVREELLRIPGIMKHVEEVIGDRYLLIAKEQIGQVLVLLDQAGNIVLQE